ncbi:hypothetical protein IFR35_25605 [Pseudomonas fluorescens]|uniref:hypothetical protein n=1 Tax=Pseudomonas fluorescens TaxID=294 RepID=UPI001780C58F|nr:hypothetical protein [Pseudomonas fluorescens]MBD8194838.1 hypothetical protein [Pseudomonas fluorescens]MBD8229764.1 hypothetical protein [Pseudomonas fluorescens]MBD8787582.1 hypothetical protein [Pseudomonas fluorescens]MBD8820088.1 hypothetical protein [Pseudomonas fluorescens]
MLSPINTVPFPTQYPAAPQDDAALQRKKRSIDAPRSQLEPQESDGSARNSRRTGSGGLDSLGKGNLL